MGPFDAKVSRTMRQLQSDGFAAMAASITRRRMAWLDEALPAIPGYQEFAPREAYELLFFAHMGLERHELPVVEEAPDRIAWLSYNRCSLLEACTALGWDTRRVCRPVNERATQAFLSRINPRLRFHRSYEEIRPHAAYCREWIIRVDLDAYMRLAIEEAWRSGAEGNKGYGAVVVYDGRVVGRGYGTPATECDPGLHAEANAIRQAVRAGKDGDLCGAILFSTGEPCPTCASLAIRANLTSIVYGASSQEAEPGRGRVWVSFQEIAGRSPGPIEVIAGILPV